MLAQAQECFWQKAVIDHMKDGLIARLAAQVSDFYDRALSTGMASVNIPSDWITHITAKKLHFYSAAQYRKGIEAVSGVAGSNYGEEVARLQEALRNVNKALERKNFLGRGVREDLLGLQSMLQRDSERAEKDNDLIYLCITSRKINSSSCPGILISHSHRKSTHGQTHSPSRYQRAIYHRPWNAIIPHSHSLCCSSIYRIIQ
jgi:hypothetical protein